MKRFSTFWGRVDRALQYRGYRDRCYQVQFKGLKLAVFGALALAGAVILFVDLDLISGALYVKWLIVLASTVLGTASYGFLVMDFAQTEYDRVKDELG